LAIPWAVLAQSPDSLRFPSRFRSGHELGIITGVSQFKYTSFELGLSKLSYASNGCAFGTGISGWTLSADYNPFTSRPGVEVTGWTSMMTMIMFAVNVNSYSDYVHYNLGIKPMMGLGNGWIQLVYGYNFQPVNHQLNGINTNCLSLRFHIPLVKRK
jgi:hypothetical protein